MKTIFRISAAVVTASLVFASCAKENLLEDRTAEPVAAGTRVIAVSFSNSATKSELGTNGVTPKFVSGDKIMVSNGTDTEECTVNCKGDVASISPKLTGALTAVYPAAVWSDSEPYFTVSATQDGTFASANISTATIAADAESALFEHQTAVLRFYVDASIGVKSFTVTSSTADIADGAKTITVDPDGDATLDTVTDDPGKRICYVAVLPTTSNTDLTFTSVTTTQTDCPASTVTRNVASVSLVKNRIYDAFVPYYIDLGANGKWGYCNIGAFLPEDIGEHFAWGETTGHRLNPDGTTYEDGHVFNVDPFGSFANLKAECPDGVLPLTRDAAHVNWGGEWRMPTMAEVYVFHSMTDKEWDSVHQGYLFGQGDSRLFISETDQLWTSEYDVPSPLKQANWWNHSGSCSPQSYLNPHSIRALYDVPYVPPVPEPLSGLFSVSPTKKVRFSPGNLQFKAGDGTTAKPEWRFAEHQYDFVGYSGNATSSGRDTQAAWIDLFGWGATGMNLYGPAPYSAVIDDSAYKTGATVADGEKLTRENGADWGVCMGESWRTLTSDEMDYLFGDNSDRLNLFVLEVKVRNVSNCCILYPDGYTGTIVSQGDVTSYDEEEEWAAAEEAGVVCLPPTGQRYGTSYYSTNTGYYWTSDGTLSDDLGYAYESILSTFLTIAGADERCMGNSVRLVMDAPSEPIVYVDLGLSVEWATCNLGATKPEEYGEYFAWGATEGYKPTGNTFSHSFNWTNAPFNHGSSIFNSEYFNSVRNTVCPDNILASEYDAAHVIMGETWRMPKYYEFEELLNNTNNSWTSNYNSTGVSGYVFTSKTDPSKSIFLPAGNRADGTALNYLNEYGCYWLAEQDQWDDRFAWYISFSNGSASKSMDEHRYGMPIRAVRPKE